MRQQCWTYRLLSGCCPYASVRAGFLLLRRDECEQARVIVRARRAAREVRAHAEHADLGIDGGELELDEAVEMAEALLARELRALRPEQCLEAGVRHLKLLTGRSRVAPDSRAACAVRRGASCKERRAWC